ncbi:nucleotidyltransferase domain-containing protein [Candidatus Woesearchaeota archaeon]|nr:nucleotidyltransferase domain-containing protein [Candidatus Woesearchaeota archaeon]MBW3017710.1 nucleotidyltransferase domain-containing protein [Candidatus Woesearchaeota archaeon]
MAEKKEGIEDIPKEAKEQIEKLKKKLDSFKKQVLEKFDEYIMGIGLLPPSKEDKEKKEINVIILVNDTDSKKMSKYELKDKLSAIIENIAKDIDPNMKPQTFILTELWQSCYDGKYDLVDLFGISAPVHDTGMLAGLKIANLHRTMVIKKFEKYVVAYVLWGSLARGEPRAESDIDIGIVIDDTDVKKMSRAELKDKLRAIIIGMGIEAGEVTGIKNKLNVNIFILTDIWESIKDAVPTIFTFLRDGVPLFDRGTFMPWKYLLKMGRIKPSPEAIEMFMSSGEQLVSRVKFKLIGLVESDIYWATLTPSQAALMLYGLPPPTPAETVNLLNEVFVRKEKLLEPSYVEIMKKIRDYYKGVEHGDIKEISGKEVDELLSDADKYLKRLKRLFKQIEKMKEEENVVELYDTILTVSRDCLQMEGVKEVTEEELIDVFKKELIEKGKIPDKFLRTLKDMIKAKKDYEANKLTKTEVEQVQKDGRLLIRVLVEFMQRKRGLELERTKIRVKYGPKFGEVTLLDDVAFIVPDIDAEEKEFLKAKIKPDGSLAKEEKSSIEEYEDALAKVKIPKRAFIKEPIFEDLKKIFGKDVEILISF